MYSTALSLAIYACTVLANDKLFSLIPEDNMECPSADAVKSVKLINAIQHEQNSLIWNFPSTVISHKGVEWNIWFGTFLPEVKSKRDALVQGQIYFDHAVLKINEPTPYPDKTFYYCDYMTPGSIMDNSCSST